MRTLSFYLKVIMERIVLDIERGKNCPEHLFGTANLRDLRIRPFFRDNKPDLLYIDSLASEMQNDSILVSCCILDTGKSEVDFNIGLPEGPNRPKEELLVSIVLYLAGEGYNVKINDVEKGVHVSLPLPYPILCIGVSCRLLEDESGNIDILKSFEIQRTVSGLYDLILSYGSTFT